MVQSESEAQDVSSFIGLRCARTPFLGGDGDTGSMSGALPISVTSPVYGVGAGGGDMLMREREREDAQEFLLSFFVFLFCCDLYISLSVFLLFPHTQKQMLF